MVHEKKSVVRLASQLVVQAAGLVGFGAFVAGVGQMYMPAAWMVGGGLVVVWAVLKSRSSE